ncbi:AC4 protein [Euphorbia mosaic Peru virus]|uniref:AC4 protein n=1 Tax=Euphorbia mosaic Peru virus TaxID=2169733 RepID=A9JPY4_9GEMI|nr:AC4 protein [Euphorbia mosaic Peru virus]CAP07294.1 AC4 protein [Euphorbia mosaic Peru virus]
MRLCSCFGTCHGLSSSPRTSESLGNNTPMGSPISTVLFNSPASPISRMLDFSTSLTPDGLPDSIQMSKLQKTPTPSRITSPRRVIIVNPDSTKCLGVPSPIKTMSITTPSMQQLQERLSTS